LRAECCVSLIYRSAHLPSRTVTHVVLSINCSTFMRNSRATGGSSLCACSSTARPTLSSICATGPLHDSRSSTSGGCTHKIFSEHRLTRTPWRWMDLCTTLEDLTQFVLHVLCFSSFGTALAVAPTTEHTFSFKPVRLQGRFLRACV
jgi:hypothetical protein